MTAEHNLYKMKFVAKSMEEPDNVKKSRVVTFNIFIPPYLLSFLLLMYIIYRSNMSGPILKKKWKDFVSNKMIHLFHVCGVYFFFLKNNNQIISDDEMKRMSESQLSSLWDGRIESLLTVDT